MIMHLGFCQKSKRIIVCPEVRDYKEQPRRMGKNEMLREMVLLKGEEDGK